MLNRIVMLSRNVLWVHQYVLSSKKEKKVPVNTNHTGGDGRYEKKKKKGGY